MKKSRKLVTRFCAIVFALKSGCALPPPSPESRLVARAGMLIALMAGLLAGCIVIPAKATVAQTGNVQAPSGGIALSVLFSPDFSPETPKGLGGEMVECITRGLATAAPEVRLVPEEEFYRAVFGVKPGEVPLQADTIGALLARPDIRQRVGESGLTHLILVGGETRHHSGKNTGFNPYLGGAGSSTRHTELFAHIFELASSAEVANVQANAEGAQGAAIIVIFPLGWVSTTELSACHALGAQVTQSIHGKPREEIR